MDKTTTQASLKPVIVQLEEVFDRLNTKYFGDELEPPVLTVSPDVTIGAYGWCTSWRAWQDGSSNGYYEINLCAETLNRPVAETVGTLLHEMVHLLNLQLGVQDTSRGGYYHNRRFEAAAKAHGLDCEQIAKYGWCKTALSDAAKAYIDSLSLPAFSLSRPKMLTLSRTGGAKKTSSTRRYSCPCCGAVVRATREVHITCTDCDTEYVEG